jgi:hypothetical protein
MFTIGEHNPAAAYPTGCMGIKFLRRFGDNIRESFGFVFGGSFGDWIRGCFGIVFGGSFGDWIRGCFGFVFDFGHIYKDGFLVVGFQFLCDSKKYW